VARLSIQEIKKAIEQSNARWRAEETPFLKMPRDEQLRHLGYTPGPDDGSLEEQERAAKGNLQAFIAMRTTTAAAYPSSFDLRNVGGSNFITPVKDQGGCGSCVAFGTIAAVEGTVRKQRNNPNLAADYSEAHLFYCHARSEGRVCGPPNNPNAGWWPDHALNKFRDIGVADETCYPYTAGDQNCSNLCSDWQSRATKITGWRRLTSPSEMKEWISTRGPLEACFTVYDDFFALEGDIYRHVTGEVAGGHCVCCVGYNDTEQYWIMKNSWGLTFGESGYFRIAYGECGIDSWMDAIEGTAETGWIRDTRIIGLFTSNNDRNSWVYVQNLGWRKISPDNDNIHIDMLTQLTAAKASGRRVDLYQENGVIKQIYIL
jgi:C1A family cysteine protease